MDAKVKDTQQRNNTVERDTLNQQLSIESPSPKSPTKVEINQRIRGASNQDQRRDVKKKRQSQGGTGRDSSFMNSSTKNRQKSNSNANKMKFELNSRKMAATNEGAALSSKRSSIPSLNSKLDKDKLRLNLPISPKTVQSGSQDVVKQNIMKQSYPFLYMGMDLLNHQCDHREWYSDLELDVPMELIYSTYTSYEAEQLEQTMNNETEDSFEKMLIVLKKEKRKVQWQRRIQRLLNYENQIEEEDVELAESRNQMQKESMHQSGDLSKHSGQNENVERNLDDNVEIDGSIMKVVEPIEKVSETSIEDHLDQNEKVQGKDSKSSRQKDREKELVSDQKNRSSKLRIEESSKFIDEAPNYDTNNPLSMEFLPRDESSKDPIELINPIDNENKNDKNQKQNYQHIIPKINSNSHKRTKEEVEEEDEYKEDQFSNANEGKKSHTQQNTINIKTQVQTADDRYPNTGYASPREMVKSNESREPSIPPVDNVSITDDQDKTFQVSSEMTEKYSQKSPQQQLLTLPNPSKNQKDNKDSVLEDKSIITEVLSQDERETPCGQNGKLRQFNEIHNSQLNTNDNFSSQIQGKYSRALQESKLTQERRRMMMTKKKSISKNENYLRDPNVTQEYNPKQAARKMQTTIKPTNEPNRKPIPFQKSPTQNSRGALQTNDAESLAASSKFVQNMQQKIHHMNQTGVSSYKKGIQKKSSKGGAHRQDNKKKGDNVDNSSLGLTEDQKLDQLSLSLNINKINKYSYPARTTHRNQNSLRDRSLDQNNEAINYGQTFSALSRNSNQHSPGINSREPPIFARSKQQFDPRQRFETNQRYRKYTAHDPRSDQVHKETKILADQSSNFAKSDSQEDPKNQWPKSPRAIHQEKYYEIYRKKSTKNMNPSKRNTIQAYQSIPYRPGDMKVVEKPVLQSTARSKDKDRKADHYQPHHRNKMYSNNLQIHTQYNRHMLKYINSSYTKRINSLIKSQRSQDSDVSTDRRRSQKAMKIFNPQGSSRNSVLKNNSQDTIARGQKNISDLKVMPINLKKMTVFKKDNSFGSMSISPRDMSQRQHWEKLSSINRDVSTRNVDQSPDTTTNQMDTSILLVKKNKTGSNFSVNEQTYTFGSQNNDELIQVNEGDYNKLMLLYKLMQSDKTSNVVHKQLKQRMINELMRQVDRRLALLRSQHNHLIKQKQLCSIYGQKFQAIMYGDVSYKDHYYGVESTTQNQRDPSFQFKTQSIPESAAATFKSKSRQLSIQNLQNESQSPHEMIASTPQPTIPPGQTTTKQDLNKTAYNVVSKSKDYNDQNIFKASQFNQMQRHSLGIRQTNKNQLHLKSKTNQILDYDNIKSLYESSKQPDDEVNFNQQQQETNEAISHLQPNEETTDSFFDFGGPRGVFTQNFSMAGGQQNQVIAQQLSQPTQSSFLPGPSPQELIQSHKFFIQFMALHEKLNYSPRSQNLIKDKVFELEVVENEIIKLIQKAEKNENQMNQTQNFSQFYTNSQKKNSRNKSNKINFSRLTFVDENHLITSQNPTKVQGSPLGFSDGNKTFKTRFHLNLNNVENPKALTQGHKFYNQKKQDFAVRHQNLKRTELSRITELHMAGENSQQNINRINQQNFQRQGQAQFVTNQSRQLIHQDSTQSNIDGQQGGGNKRSEVNLIEMDDNIFENSVASGIYSGHDRSGFRNQANSSQLTHGSHGTTYKQITEQKINHYREKIKKYSTNGKRMKNKEMTSSQVNGNSQAMAREHQNRSKTSHMQTHNLPTIKNAQGVFIESGQKIISDKPSPRSPRKSSRKHHSPQKTYPNQLHYQYKNIGSRQKLNQSINPSSFVVPFNDQAFDINVSFQMSRQKQNQLKTSVGVERQSHHIDHTRLLPNVKSSQYGQSNKFNSTKHSKILKDFLYQQRSINRNINYGMVYSRHQSAYRKAVNKSSIGSQGIYP